MSELREHLLRESWRRAAEIYIERSEHHSLRAALGDNLYVLLNMGEWPLASQKAEILEALNALATQAVAGDAPFASGSEASLRAALEEAASLLCHCGGEDLGAGIGVGVFSGERSPATHRAEAYDGAGQAVTDKADCPCAPFRGLLARTDEDR